MTVQDHLRQARQNEELAHKLGSQPLEAYDWPITVMFYTLLHFVDAYLLERYHLIPRGHTATWDRKRRQRIPGRNDYVKQYLPEIYDAYKLLYYASRRARYEGAYLTAGSVGDYQNLKDNEFTSARAFFRAGGLKAMDETCPVCEQASAPGESQCPRCGWELESDYVLGRLTPELEAAYQERLAWVRRWWQERQQREATQRELAVTRASLERLELQLEQTQRELTTARVELECLTTGPEAAPAQELDPDEIQRELDVESALTQMRGFLLEPTVPDGADKALLQGYYARIVRIAEEAKTRNPKAAGKLIIQLWDSMQNRRGLTEAQQIAQRLQHGVV